MPAASNDNSSLYAVANIVGVPHRQSLNRLHPIRFQMVLTPCNRPSHPHHRSLALAAIKAI